MGLSGRVDALSTLVDHDGSWMVQNTVLAWLPVLLAIGLFRVWQGDADPARRGPLWWFGLVLFVLFLPNAPYVVTDLVHVRADVHRLGPDVPVATTILPVYGLLVLSGFLAYYVALAQLRHYLDRCGLARYRSRVMLGLHGVVAIGIFLGRWSRLNSWEPVIRPRDTTAEVFSAFTWSYAPVLIASLFAVTAVGHFVTRAVAEATWLNLRSVLVRDRVA